MNKHPGASSGKAWLWRVFVLLLIMGLILSGSSIAADKPQPAQRPIPAVGSLVEELEVDAPAGGNPKLDSSLNQLLDFYRSEDVAGARAFATTSGMVVEGNRVQVVIETTPSAIEGMSAAVEGAGGELQGHYEGLLQAMVPVDALESLAARPMVQYVSEPLRPILLEPQVGSKTTEGVAASNANAWHGAGLDGSGVKVAVIDGGFTGYTGLLGSDLPASVTTYDWAGGGMGGSPHGTACAEIVHDMAPGATMYLHKVGTNVDLGQAINKAIADNVDVITMSLGWTLDGPGDGTGSLANMVQSARSNGIFYATAAGNDAEVNWAGTYKNYSTGGDDYHAWNGSTLWLNFMGAGDGTCIIFPAGYPVRGGLHWDDWSAVNQDYDLHLYRWPGGSTVYRVASSTNPQTGGAGQKPYEYISYTAAGGNCYAWVVERKSSSRNVCMRMIAPKTFHFDQWTTARSLSFPADSPDAITVAAVDVGSPYPLEDYSSRGPTFGSGGACSGGSIKPDISAYANVSTVSYGTGAFNGTSAATPHVGGAAALVKDAYPAYTVTQVQSFLQGRAKDLGAGGKDNLYGWGRLHMGTPPGGGGPTVTSITPSSGVNTGSVHISNLAGSGFQAGATVKLTKTGQPDINATGVSVVSASKITCDFNLSGAAMGPWHVVVTNPDANTGTLPNGFTVTGQLAKAAYLPIVIRLYPPPAVLPTRIYASADTCVLQGAPNTNFGSTIDMWAGYDHCYGGYIARSLVKFDVSDIPAGTPISKAELSLYLTDACDLGPRTHTATVYRITDSWSSGSATWNNQPGIAGAYGSAPIYSRTFKRYSIDITGLVQGWVNGSLANRGLMVRSNESSGNDSAALWFNTVNTSGTTYDPYLAITYPGSVAAGGEVMPALEESLDPAVCGPTIQEQLNLSASPEGTGGFGLVGGAVCTEE